MGIAAAPPGLALSAQGALYAGTRLAGPVLRRRPAGNYLPARPHAREQLAACSLVPGASQARPPHAPVPIRTAPPRTTHGTQGGPVARRRGPPAPGASARPRSRTGATPGSGSVLSRLVLASRRALCPNRGARATHTTAHHRSTAAASRTTPGGSDHTPVGVKIPSSGPKKRKQPNSARARSQYPSPHPPSSRDGGGAQNTAVLACCMVPRAHARVWARSRARGVQIVCLRTIPNSRKRTY